MARAGYIERMGTGIKKMRDLVKAEGLPPIKFEFDNFATVTFYRKSILEKDFSEPLKVYKKLNEALGKELNITAKRAEKIAKTLQSIEDGSFAVESFSKGLRISSRSVEKDIRFLKQHRFIEFEGSRKSGKYKLTEKYRKLKKKSHGL